MPQSQQRASCCDCRNLRPARAGSDGGGLPAAAQSVLAAEDRVVVEMHRHPAQKLRSGGGAPDESGNSSGDDLGTRSPRAPAPTTAAPAAAAAAARLPRLDQHPQQRLLDLALAALALMVFCAAARLGIL